MTTDPSNTMTLTTPSDRAIVVTRVFDAPRALVWDAMTKPEHIKRWLFGPPGWTMTECEEDLRVGGSFRWAWRSDDGQEMALSGTYREIVPHERIVRTEAFEFGCEAQMDGYLGTMVLSERDGKTVMTLTLLYNSKEARDGAIASGMEHGMNASYTRLNELVAASA